MPKDWRHPTEGRCNGYKPLFDGFNRRLAAWEEGNAKWAQGLRQNWGDGEPWIADERCAKHSYEECGGQQPDPADYMPDWPEAERTHWQMYENASEGTPISLVMEMSEVLSRWLADNGASTFGSSTATYEQWLAMIGVGWAPCAIVADGVMQSGVAASGNLP